MSRKRIDRAVQITRFATLAGGVITFILDVTANQLNALGKWVPWTVMAGGTAVFLVLWTLQHRWTDQGMDEDHALLPHVDELVGRDRAIEAVVDKARAHGVVVVHGPDGSGDSSVAIAAARRLVPHDAAHRYVDLRGERPNDIRSVRQHVLRTLGLETRIPGAQATAAVAHTLAGSGLVLVIDNVSDARQVTWVAHGVDGAHILIAGHIKTADLLDVADVPVQRLEPADALTLLRLQDAEAPPRRLARMRDRLLGVHRHSIDARINDEKDAAETLATYYLQLPRVAIQFGRWLARNPEERISAVLRALHEGEEVFDLQEIMRRRLEGLSPGGRRLLALLVTVPNVKFPDAAVAELAGTSVERASEHLGELADRYLVHLGASGSRVAEHAENLAESAPDRAVAKAHVRLAAHCATLAAAHAELLDTQEYAEAEKWFADQDVMLRELLGMPRPPRRAAPHLWEIAGALDLWFSREQRTPERRQVATNMRDRAEELGDTTAQGVALVRLAAIARRRRMIDHGRAFLSSAEELAPGSWRPQLKTEWALYHLAAGDVDAARNDLRRAQNARPQRDLYGRMTDLINLAVLDIRLDRHGSAAGSLEEAVVLAGRAGSTSGHAHALELMGIARRGQGQPAAAERAWSEAESLYQAIGDETGRARCERHRGAGDGRP
jgi:hypothetical protein